MSSTFHDVRPLTSPVYAPLGDVGRTLHWDDVQMSYGKRMLIPQRFNNTNVAAVRNKMVLWIAPVSRTLGHNYFGNVTFIADWPSILEKFGPNLYLVDQSIHNKIGHTRVLLTTSTYGSLEKVDLNGEGSAIIERDCQLLHAKESNCKNGVQGLHQLQIAIETDGNGGEWLYGRCRVKVEDHSDVNHEVRKRNNVQRRRGFKSYQSYKCFKFNTAQGKPCPYMLSATSTKILLASQCPELSNRIDISESDAAEKKPNRIEVSESDTRNKKPKRIVVAESDTNDKKPNRIDLAESDSSDKKPYRIDATESDSSEKKPNRIDLAESDTRDKKPNRIEKRPSKETQPLVVYDDFDFESVRRAEEYDYSDDDETYQFDYFEFEDQEIWNNDDDDHEQEYYDSEPDYDDPQEVEPETVDVYEQEQFETEPDYDDAQEVEPETVEDYEQEQFEAEPDYDDAQEVEPETVDDYEQDQFETEPDYEEAEEVEPETIGDYEHEQLDTEPDYEEAQEVEPETVDDYEQEQFETEHDYQDDQDFGPLDPYELEAELETFVPDDDVYNELDEHQFDTDRDFDDDYYEQDNYYSEY